MTINQLASSKSLLIHETSTCFEALFVGLDGFHPELKSTSTRPTMMERELNQGLIP